MCMSMRHVRHVYVYISLGPWTGFINFFAFHSVEKLTPEIGAPDNGTDNGADYGADTESEPGTVDDKELVVSLCCC